MRETDERVTCECGRWRWAGAVDGWVEQYHHRHIAVRGHESFYCWDCHTELTVAEDGTPVAEAMVPADETLAESIARQQADPAKGGLAAVVGKWPGDESDAEIEEALAAMRGRAPDDEYHECAGYGFDVHAYIRESLSEAARLRRELAEYREAYRDADDGCRKLEAEVARLEARVTGLRTIAEDCGEGTAREIGCPMAEKCVPATAPCLAVTAARGSDEWDEAMENVCKWREDTEREHAGRCWADVWEHEQGLPWPTHEEDKP